MRKRSSVSSSKGASAKVDDDDAKKKSQPAQRKDPTLKDWLPIIGMFAVFIGVMIAAYLRYGPSIFFGAGWKDLTMAGLGLLYIKTGT